MANFRVKKNVYNDDFNNFEEFNFFLNIINGFGF